jgi:hypothetical protein
MTQLLRAEQLTHEHVDALNNQQLDQYIYEALCTLIPSGSEVWSWPLHCWFPIESQRSVMTHVFAPHSYKRSLPPLHQCGGTSVGLLGDGRFLAHINKSYRSDILTSYSDSEGHAVGKVWLKAFINGWVDTRYAQISSSWKYPEVRFEENVFRASSLTVQSVTPVETVTVTSPAQTVIIETPSIESVTPIQSVTSETRLCLCGCGAPCSGRQKLVSVACRKRYSRARNAQAPFPQSVTDQGVKL